MAPAGGMVALALTLAACAAVASGQVPPDLQPRPELNYAHVASDGSLLPIIPSAALMARQLADMLREEAENAVCATTIVRQAPRSCVPTGVDRTWELVGARGLCIDKQDRSQALTYPLVDRYVSMCDVPWVRACPKGWVGCLAGIASTWASPTMDTVWKWRTWPWTCRWLLAARAVERSSLSHSQQCTCL